MKREGSELLHVYVYATRLLQLPKLMLCFLDDVVREEHRLEFHLEFFLSVNGTKSLFYFRLFTPPPQHGHLRKIQHDNVDLIFVALHSVTLEVILQVLQKILNLLRVTDAFEHRWLRSLDLGLPISFRQ